MRLKQLYLFLTGRIHFAPAWFYKLPKFFQPIYDFQTESFTWLGKCYPVPNAQLGLTLFGCLKQKRGVTRAAWLEVRPE